MAPGLLVLAMLAAASIVALVVGARGAKDATRSDVTYTGGGLEQASVEDPVSARRPIFKHSVIPGGVFTPEELQNVLAVDAVAAAHYQGLDAAALRTETVKQERYAYVSYRKDDQIYWTQNKVRISQGETILTDGTTEVRARCGNCISEVPRFPVADAEPDVAELDRLVDDPADQQNASLSAMILAALDSSLSALSRAVSPGSSGGNTPNGASGNGAFASGGSGSGMPGAGGGRARGASSANAASPAAAEAGPGSVQPGAASLPDPGSPAVSPDTPAQAGNGTGPGSNGRADTPVADSVIAGPAPGGTSQNPPSLRAPDGPSVFPPSGPSGPSGDPFADNLSIPPVAGAGNLPGIELPPGLNPTDPARVPSTQDPSSAAGPDGKEPAEAEVASIPEPGSLFLLGAGAVATLWRNSRTRRGR